MQILLSLFVWFEVSLCFILFFPLQLALFFVTALFDRKKAIMHYHSSLWCCIGLALSPLWRIRLQGTENLDRKKAHVVIMNHQSLIDGLLVFRLFYPIKMVGKKSLGLVPILGWNLFLSGHLLVDRKSLKSQLDTIRKMEELTGRGESIFVFPEGTRTRDGNLGEFRKGAFRSAANAGTPVLPVVIDGAFQILPRSGFLMGKKRDIIIRVLPAVQAEKGENPASLAGRCRSIMAAELAEMRESCCSAENGG